VTEYSSKLFNLLRIFSEGQCVHVTAWIKLAVVVVEIVVLQVFGNIPEIFVISLEPKKQSPAVRGHV
jgi:hypothetical protein